MNSLPSIFRVGRRFVWQRLAWVMSSPRCPVPMHTSTYFTQTLTYDSVIECFYSYHIETHFSFECNVPRQVLKKVLKSFGYLCARAGKGIVWNRHSSECTLVVVGRWLSQWQMHHSVATLAPYLPRMSLRISGLMRGEKQKTRKKWKWQTQTHRLGKEAQTTQFELLSKEIIDRHFW